MRSRTIDTPIGPVTLAGEDRLRHLVMRGQAHEPDASAWGEDPTAFTDVVEQLDAYFAGELEDFDVDLELVGTEFQRSVWQALRDIPYGETWSYGRLAAHIDRPSAVRAVGLANGRNPIAIIVPCHRVIGADGSMTGYGGGIERKVALLRLERAVEQQQGVLELGAEARR
ncbi:methylated-DNA--[protein]-cysteine S-methyltransferase [Dermatobacter hominis]|uniref:methylated-DNA--[protein]-cysteine S-methyltransferase n=1 Tax=Dermatobacter hominis TaxID=2884263 RepID=UPI001D0F575B|nr:methylated-DNA--[protein]-cysteine S-methyltransferase [Dermatobacter hominis]UDY34322.1 methylated-DNA--[protein]-cysteine S-methyltransferase [Dermatobacter hominis]